MVQRDIEEALDLGRMQVNSDDTGNARALQQVSHQLGRNGFAATGLAVLPGIAVERDHGRNVIGGSALERICHNQQFHDIVIDNRAACRLNNKHIFSAHAFVDHRLHFTVVKAVDHRIAQRGSQICRDFTCQVRICVTGKNSEFVFVCQHLDILPVSLGFLKQLA